MYLQIFKGGDSFMNKKLQMLLILFIINSSVHPMYNKTYWTETVTFSKNLEETKELQIQKAIHKFEEAQYMHTLIENQFVSLEQKYKDGECSQDVLHQAHTELKASKNDINAMKRALIALDPKNICIIGESIKRKFLYADGSYIWTDYTDYLERYEAQQAAKRKAHEESLSQALRDAAIQKNGLYSTLFK